jgi:hypothetical protein
MDLSPSETARLCEGCVQCCTYVGVEVDPPRAAWEYDQWIWALHHEGIELILERPERWLLNIHTRCRQLTDQGRCAIHGRHPVLCREYDPRHCERHDPMGGIRAWFRNAGDLEDWLRRERPVHWRRLEAFRRVTPAGRPVADAAAAGGPTATATAFVALQSVTRTIVRTLA